MWTEQDVQLALQWQARQRGACPSCTTRPEEWEKDRFAYVATTRACPGCEVITQEKRNIPEHAQEYVHVGLILRELAQELERDA